MALELVTGYQGQDHVTAEQWADFNRGIYGDAAILPVGSEMAVDIQTANQITVKDGIGVFDGREVYIGYGETENIAIASGTQGMLRNDIVVIKYTKQEETGVESVAFEVVEGTPAANNQTDPAYSDQDIRTGVFTSQKPFCRVRINGTAIEGIDMLVDVKEIKEHAFNDLANNLTTTEPGHGLDARQGRELKQDVDALNSALETKQNVYYTSVAPLNEAPFASNKNMVLISQYLDGENNKSGYFSINDNNRSEWKGLSGLMPQSGDFIGFREVYVKQGTPGTEHIMAKITEMHPICGRQYFNFYNHGAWVGWNVISPTS